MYLLFFKFFFSFKLLQNIEQSSLWYILGPCWSSIFKYSSVYMSIWNSQCIPPHFSSHLVTISSFSKPVNLFLFFFFFTNSIKKAEYWQTDAFKLCCWRRFLRVPWTLRRSNQSILKEMNPEYSLEVLMLKLNMVWYPLYMESKKKLYKWTYLQNRKGLTDLENKLMVVGGPGGAEDGGKG